jgi:HAD superfamily hydrolase (TIGR01509 family)
MTMQLLSHPARRRSSMLESGTRSLRGLIFDMGDVLYDATVWRRWLWRLLTHMGMTVEYRRLFEAWDRDFLAAVHRGEREYLAAFRDFLGALGLRPGQVDEVVAASHAQRRQLEEHTRAYPGVAATLGKLRAADIRLAVLSDSESTSAQLQDRLGRLGLAGCFSGVVSSFDLRHTKPDRVCYEAAISTVALPANDCAFVGHDADELAGAAAVGLRTVAFNYEPDVIANVYLERFEQLLEHVRPAEGQMSASLAPLVN